MIGSRSTRHGTARTTNRSPNRFHPSTVCLSENLAPGLTTYQVVVDPRSMFTGKRDGVQLKTVSDGTSNTLLFSESTTPVAWTQPGGLSLASSEPSLGMGSQHPGGFNVSMTDGSVRFFRSPGGKPLPESNLKGLVTRNGGEVVTPP